MSKLMKADSAYREWLLSVAGRFRQSQIKAAMKVNDEMLRFYWTLGRDISCMHSKAGYGSSFYKSVSVDPHDIFRYVHSFSITNLKYVQYFYELYPESRISPRLEDNFKTQENRPQLGGDSGTEIFLSHGVIRNS